MKLIVASPGVSTRDRRFIEHELERDIPAIKKHLVVKDAQSRMLRARLTKTGGEETPLFTLTLTVHLPDSPVVVQKKDLDLKVLIHRSIAALKKELKRVGSRIRKEHLKRRRTSARESFSTFVEEVKTAQQEEPLPSTDPHTHPIFARLRPITGRIYSYAREHIRTAQLAGEVPLNYFSAHDLVDQAIVRVIESEALPNMDGQQLEMTLYNYIDGILDEEAGRRHPDEKDVLSLESAADIDELFSHSHPEEEQAEFYQPFEALRLGDVLADHHAVDPEHHMSDHEEYRLILKRLTGFPAKARSAFFLNLMEGFEPYEISMMQGRDEDAVLADVEACRQALKDSLGPHRHAAVK